METCDVENRLPQAKPNCLRLKKFAAYEFDEIEFDFYLCLHCNRLWREAGRWDEDKRWYPTNLEGFMEDGPFWSSGFEGSQYPAEAFTDGMNSFHAWVEKLPHAIGLARLP